MSGPGETIEEACNSNNYIISMYIYIYIYMLSIIIVIMIYNIMHNTIVMHCRCVGSRGGRRGGGHLKERQPQAAKMSALA